MMGRIIKGFNSSIIVNKKLKIWTQTKELEEL